MLVGCAGAAARQHFICCVPWKALAESLSTPRDSEKAYPFSWVLLRLPGYLDRTQMVTVAGKNEMALDEFNRWVESLRDSFYRVLQEDLSSLLKTPEVYRYDQEVQTPWTYQVFIDVTRFDCAPGGEAVLTAFWTVKGMGRQHRSHKA